MQYLKYFLIAFAAWNLIVFLTYGIDKLKAKKEKWRIPEKTLLLMALFLGGTGALIGMGVSLVLALMSVKWKREGV